MFQKNGAPAKNPILLWCGSHAATEQEGSVYHSRISIIKTGARMGSVVKKPLYKTPEPLSGPSFAAATGNDPKTTSPKLMVEDLARSGLTPNDTYSEPLRIFTPGTVRGKEAIYQLAAYYIPYFDLTGRPILDAAQYPLVYRLRQKLTPAAEEEGKYGKYVGQKYSKLPVEYRGIPYILPKFWEYEGAESLFICEGEKKAAKVMLSLEVPALGIPGKDNWRTKSGETRLHGWIRQAINHIGPESVYIIPDGDIRRPLINKSYDELRYAIRAEFEGEIIIPELPHHDDKIDDLIVEWEENEQSVAQEFYSLPPRTTYREPVARLVEDYNLANTTTTAGRIVVSLIEANYTKLFSHHPSYKGLWYDSDRHTAMMDKQVITDNIARNLVEFMQDNLSMGKVNMRAGIGCLVSVCKTKSISLFLEDIQRTEWDGTERLEAMFIDYCGAPDTPLVREVGSKWLAAACSRLKFPGIPVDYMVIASGPQGIGKSSFPEILWGADYVVTMLSGDMNNNGSEIIRKTNTGLLCNFDELSGLMGTERNKLKGWITVHQEDAREMYANFPTKYKRKFVIYGSTNDIKDFLPPDSSGHRRYVVVPMEQIQFAKLEEDRDQLWAEALYSLENETVTDVGNVWLANTDSQQYVAENQHYAHLCEVLPARLLNKASVNNCPRMVQNGLEYYGFSMLSLKRLLDISNVPNYVLKDFKGAMSSHGWLELDQKKIDGVRYSKHWWCPVKEFLEEN